MGAGISVEGFRTIFGDDIASLIDVERTKQLRNEMTVNPDIENVFRVIERLDRRIAFRFKSHIIRVESVTLCKNQHNAKYSEISFMCHQAKLRVINNDMRYKTQMYVLKELTTKDYTGATQFKTLPVLETPEELVVDVAYCVSGLDALFAKEIGSKSRTDLIHAVIDTVGIGHLFSGRVEQVCDESQEVLEADDGTIPDNHFEYDSELFEVIAEGSGVVVGRKAY